MEVVVAVIRRVRVGMKDLGWFIGLFMFLGLIGVGKIELVWVLVGFLFDWDDVLVWIDMLEYMEKYVVFCLVGVFFGYVGYD